MQLAAAGDGEALRQLRPHGVHFKLHNGHGGDGRQIVRIEDVKQRLGQFRKFIIKFVMNARRQKGEPFDEAFDVGIGAAVRFELQAAGGGRIFLGKVLSKLANELQFALIVG